MKIVRFIALIQLLFVIHCTSPSERKGVYIPENISRQDKLRYNNYLLQGKKNYIKYCMNCHQADGKGLVDLYPPLAQSDYLMADMERVACLIKNGIEEDIIVNGKVFGMKMPANLELRNIQIAEIMTFICNSWGNEKGLIPVKDVDNYLEKCK